MSKLRSSRLGLAIALSCAVSACASPTLTQTFGTGGAKGQTAKPSAAPTTGSATGTTPGTGAGPSPAPGTVPSASPLPPAPALGTDSKRIQDAVTQQLLAVARVGFTSNRGSLISDKGLGLIADNGLGIVANNGVGMISNNGGGLISDNGSGLVSDKGSAYRVRATDTAINPAPLGDEILFIDRHWPDNSRSIGYTKVTADGSTYLRRVRTLASGTPVEEQLLVATGLAANGVHATIDETHTLAHPDGTLALATTLTRAFDTATGMQTRITAKPGAIKVREPKSGLAIDLDTLSLDATTGAGSFRYTYASLGLTETGTLTGVARDANGDLQMSAFDPLAYYDGQSRVEDAQGKLLYTKKQVTTGGVVQRDYDLGNGLTATLKAADGLYKGTLSENGKEVAKLEQATRADGSVVFSLFFPEQPTTPVAVGYGITSFEVAPKANPMVPGWRVATLAGAANAAVGTTPASLVSGYANGDGLSARFAGLGMIVKSRKTANRYYLADTGNHRIRALTLNGRTATVETYAGDGMAGDTDGAKLSARFNQPIGLAVGADDTLYVSDNHRIRKIAPDGTVSTLAGTGTAGYAEGKGNLARFNAPAGLALSDTTLYVADSNNHRVRKVNVSTGDVTTYAGTGAAGSANGAVAAAQLDSPRSLALDGAGALYVLSNGLIRKVAGGQVTTYAGGGSTLKANLDGVATDGTLTALTSLAVGPDGQLYLGGRDVRRIGADGKLTSMAGLASELPGYLDGPVTDAAFYGIGGLAFADGGWVLVSDGTTVRLIAPPAP